MFLKSLSLLSLLPFLLQEDTQLHYECLPAVHVERRQHWHYGRCFVVNEQSPMIFVKSSSSVLSTLYRKVFDIKCCTFSFNVLRESSSTCDWEWILKMPVNEDIHNAYLHRSYALVQWNYRKVFNIRCCTFSFNVLWIFLNFCLRIDSQDASQWRMSKAQLYSEVICNTSDTPMY